MTAIDATTPPNPGPETITDRVRANYADVARAVIDGRRPDGEASNDAARRPGRPTDLG